MLQHIDDWKLGEDFKEWITAENIFCSTLVDRIVPGRIKDAKEVEKLEADNGYKDDLMDVGECFGVWIDQLINSIRNVHKSVSRVNAWRRTWS